MLAVGNSFRLPNATDGRPIPEGVSLIHINADSGDLEQDLPGRRALSWPTPSWPSAA